MRNLLILSLLAASAFAQSNVTVQPSAPARGLTTLMTYDGTNANLLYVCKAWSMQGTAFDWKRSDTTLTSIAVSSNVGTITFSSLHGLAIGNTVVVSGATVDTDLNGTYVVASAPTTSSITVTTVAVADATYNEATLKVSTQAPRTNAKVWAIQKFYYDDTSNTTSATAVKYAGGSSGYSFACDSKATYGYQ